MYRYLSLVLFIGLVWGQVTVDGYAYLENQMEHDSIQIIFEKIVPDSSMDTIYTASGGYYSIQLDSGVYDISYNFLLSNEYYSRFLREEDLFETISLPDIILLNNIIHVPQDYISITSALNEVKSGDTILVDSGIYFENIYFDNAAPNITLIGSGIDNSILDGFSNNRVVSFSRNTLDLTDTATVIMGFTLQNGYSNRGAGIKCRNFSPILMNLKIINNISFGDGGGIELSGNSNPIISDVIVEFNSSVMEGGGMRISEGCNPILNNVIIKNNLSETKGGGVSFYGTSATLNNITIVDNIANTRGGGIHIENSESITINNSIITGNLSTGGGGPPGAGGIENLSNQETHVTTLLNTIISNNSGAYGIINSSQGIFEISFSNIYDNYNNNCSGCGDWIGANVTTNVNGDSCDIFSNIEADPLFCDSENEDYSLAENSPCINAGENGIDIGVFGVGCESILSIKNQLFPKRFMLYQNYPNPFNNGTNIEYKVMNNEYISILIYNVNGILVKSLVNKKKSHGDYLIKWNGKDERGVPVSSGTYFYSIKNSDHFEIKKMIILK